MQLGLALGACAVGLAWLISESVRRWFKQRADARLWAAIEDSTPRDFKVTYQLGVLNDKQNRNIQTVFGAQDTTLPQAKTRKRKTRK